MRFISLEQLWRQSSAALLRFPLSILSAAIGVGVAIYLIEMEGRVGNALPYINLLLTAALGIPLFFCGAIVSERWGGAVIKWGSALVALVLLGLIYLTLPGTDDTHNTTIPYIRYGLFNVIVHLLVSFAPFVRVRQLNGFWNYNKGLFIRIVTAGLYSGVMFAGLALAIGALNELFDADIDVKRFPELFIIIMGMFNTWFFVAGIPEDLDALEEVREYPKGLKVFTQYILLPLLLLYLVILYGYGTKILLAWDWPRGIVAYMISCIAVLGIFTLLLIHPYSGQQGNGWIRKVGLGYYWALFPLIGLLFIAIWLRLDDYGITVNRYAVVVLGIWLTVVAVYFAGMRGDNIKLIPVTLALMLGLTSFGPWGMFAVGERSQVGRLEQLLTDSGILKDGKVQHEALWTLHEKEGLVADSLNANNALLADSLKNEVISILNYLDNHHGFAAIQPWFVQNVDSLITLAVKKDRHVSEAQTYMQTMGLSYEYTSIVTALHHRQFHSEDRNVVPIEGYSYMMYWSGGSDDLMEIELEGTKYIWRESNGIFTLSSEAGKVSFSLNDLAMRLSETNGDPLVRNVHPNKMTLRNTLGPWNVVMEANYLQMTLLGEKPRVLSGNGRLFFGRKQP